MFSQIRLECQEDIWESGSHGKIEREIKVEECSDFKTEDSSF